MVGFDREVSGRDEVAACLKHMPHLSPSGKFVLRALMCVKFFLRFVQPAVPIHSIYIRVT